MPPWTYESALAFWYGRINYEQTSPLPDDLKLDRMRVFLRLLGDPHERLRIVHVAGSKGKGSTSALLESILRRSGYRTGLFTSPHLCRIEERIQVDGQPISAEELTALLAVVRDVEPQINPTGGAGRSGLTFFEVAAGLGFLHFARRRVDVAVVEVGLGGRFDSTNVCRPLVSVITSISLDHTRQLGDKLASIAREKAGIVKSGRPVVSGVIAPEARPVIVQTCQQRRAPLRQLGPDFWFTCEPGRVAADVYRKPRARIVTSERAWPEMELGLLGEHQAANAAVTVACVEELRRLGLTIADAAVADGLAEVHWPARLEVLTRRPLVVLDCAHNVASVQALVDTLNESFPPGRRLLILAVSNDKDIAGMLRVLAPHFAHVYATRYRSSARALPPEQIAELLRPAQVPCTICENPTQAWQAARAAARPEDLICITGSVFLAGELHPLVMGETSSNQTA
jgi:dihydrofolate synthase/folylpolyglutamate synthase